MAIGTFSSVLQVSVERSQVRRRVGRGRGRFPDRVRVRRRARSRTSIRARSRASVRWRPASSSATRRCRPPRATAASVTLEAIEPEAYDEVVAGRPSHSACRACSSVRRRPRPRGRTTIRSRPSSRRAPGRAAPTSPTATSSNSTIRGRPVTFRVVGRLDDFPGMARGGAFVVAPFASLVGRLDREPDRPDGLLRRRRRRRSARACARPPRRRSGTVVVARHERYAAMHDAPLVAAVTSGFTIALLVAAAYAALAVVAVVILHAQRRVARGRLPADARPDRPAGRPADRWSSMACRCSSPSSIGVGARRRAGLADRAGARSRRVQQPGHDGHPAGRLGRRSAWSPRSVAAVVAIAVLVSSWLARRLEPAACAADRRRRTGWLTMEPR